MVDLQGQVISEIISRNPAEKKLELILSILRGSSEMSDNLPINEPFFNERDARVAAGKVSRATFFRWQKKGLVSFRVGRRKLFKLSDINKFVLLKKETEHGDGKK